MFGPSAVELSSWSGNFRMPYGHRSHNYLYIKLDKKRIGIFKTMVVVDDKSIPEGWEIWFRNANDETVEVLDKTNHFECVQP